MDGMWEIILEIILWLSFMCAHTCIYVHTNTQIQKQIPGFSTQRSDLKNVEWGSKNLTFYWVNIGSAGEGATCWKPHWKMLVVYVSGEVWFTDKCHQWPQGSPFLFWHLPILLHYGLWERFSVFQVAFDSLSSSQLCERVIKTMWIFPSSPALSYGVFGIGLTLTLPGAHSRSSLWRRFAWVS